MDFPPHFSNQDMTSLTLQESEIYDRQIRLWGIEAQQRLQSSRVLFAGNFCTTSAEIAKNLVLAGFSATILDPNVVLPEDLGSNFLLTEDTIGKSRALSAHANLQQLNPMVKVTSLQEPTSNVSADFIATEKYNVVVLSGPIAMNEMVRINQACREAGAAFFFLDMYGFLGIGFSDLGDHFSYKTGSVDEGTDKVVTVQYTPINNALTTPWKELDAVRFGMSPIYFAWHCMLHYMNDNGLTSLSSADLEPLKLYGNELCQKQDFDRTKLDDNIFETCTRCYGCDVGPACAIMGGLIGQEIVKSIARKKEPFQNVFVLDAMGEYSRGGVRVHVVPPSLKAK